jgi:hypothetical protein
MKGNNGDAVINGTPERQDLRSHLKNLTWGLDIIQGGLADLEKSTRYLNLMTSAWVLVPGDEWRFTPSGIQYGGVTNPNKRNFSSILCTFSQTPIFHSEMRSIAGLSAYILDQEEMDVLLNARKRGNRFKLIYLVGPKFLKFNGEYKRMCD